MKRFWPGSARHLLTTALLVGTALAAGCDAEPASQGDHEQCTPGTSIPCTCDGGQRGRAWCLDDGSGHASCTCYPDDQDLSPADVRQEEEETEQEDDSGGCPCQQDAEEDQDSLDGPVDLTDPTDEDPTPSTDGTEEDPEQEEEPDGIRQLGEDCTRAGECETDICIALSVAGTPYAVCTTPCCHEMECPEGFGCLQLGAGRYCLPSRIFPSGYTFIALTGYSCGVGGNACKSGICDTTNDLCRGTCCTDGDCLAAPCHWSLAGSTLRTFCDPLALLSGDGRTGDICYSEYDCRSGVCVPNSEAGWYQCADFCCGSSDCPGGTTCGLVVGFTSDAVVRACVPIPLGDYPDGSECTVDTQCTSGLCVESRCRHLCCLDRHCLPPERCLPRTTPEGVLAPVCVDPEE